MAAPKGKHMFGVVKVGERGQIVIPKEARELFQIKPGDMLMALGDEVGPYPGLAFIKNEIFMEMLGKVMEQASPEDLESEFERDVKNGMSKEDNDDSDKD